MDVFLSTLAPDGTENWRCLDYNASCNAPQCSNTCGALVAGDTKCRDGGFGSLLPAICDYGTNCAVCGPRDNAPIEVVGNDNCTNANNGVCEDGAAGSILLTETEFGYSGMTCACGLGTDHTDCAQYGNRTTPVACDAPVALPYSDDALVGRGAADIGPLVCHQVTYPTEDASWNFASRYNFTQGYSATLSFRMYNRAGNKFLSTAPYRAIIRVYANNIIGPTSAYGNNLADTASSQTFDSGYVTAVGDEAEYSEDIVHTFYNLTLGRGNPFVVRVMHISRETQDYWPDISVQFASIVVGVHDGSSPNGVSLRTPEFIDGNFG